MALLVGELQGCMRLGIASANCSSRGPCSSADSAPRQRFWCRPGHLQWGIATRRLFQEGGAELRRAEGRRRVGGLLLQEERVGCSVRSSATHDTAAQPAGLKAGRYPGEKKGFVEEMRFVAMKLHTKDQAKEGEQEAQTPVAKWVPTVDGYIQFLVDSKKVYDTLEKIVEEAADPSYAVFRNTGLERSAALAQDLEWFRSEGHDIPEPGPAGRDYADYLLTLAKDDPPAFICHYYNVYFAHTAGGRFIGKKVADDLLDGRTLEFYKWDGDVKEHLAAVKEKLNKVAEEWSRTAKNHCLEETELSFSYSGKLLRLIATAQ